jgi:hypothetical protein
VRSPAIFYIATSCIERSTGTLDYAARAKNIKNKPVVLLDPQQNIVKELKMEIQALREENQRLRDALAQRSVGGAALSAGLPPPSSFFGNIESGERISKFDSSNFGGSLSGLGGVYADSGRPSKKVKSTIKHSKATKQQQTQNVFIY